MADKLLFDSERQEKRAERKRRLMPLLVLAGAIVLAVVIALLLRAGKSELHKGGEDSPYPYTWQQDSDGSLLLELPHKDDPAYGWVLEADEALARMLRAESKEKSGVTSLRLTPLEAGGSLIQLTLSQGTEQPRATASEGSKEDAPPPRSPEEFLAEGGDSLYRYSFLLNAEEQSGKLRLQLLNAAGAPLQAKQTGGRDTENPYRIGMDGRQNLTLTVRTTGEADWACEILSGQESVQVLGIGYDADTVRLILGPGETPGPAELVFRSEAAAATLRIQCSTQADGSLSLTSHSAEYGEKTPADAGNNGGSSRYGQSNFPDSHPDGTEPETGNTDPYEEEPTEQTTEQPTEQTTEQTESSETP